ncbi:anti-sigma factor [Acidisoma sp.]|uniref:anti-sigma factor n=1 Tax=Acidisoma sp. TaxID=1872115 RepID=UPI003AFFE72C
MSGTEDDRDLLAAEYVLGVLEGPEREGAVRRADQDAAFGAAIAEWEERLAPLAAIVPPVTPPAALWQRIEASCGLVAAPLSRAPLSQSARSSGPSSARGFLNALGFWRGTTALGFGLAAAIAVVAVVDRRVPPAPAPASEIPVASAILNPPKGAPAFVAEATPDRTLVLKPLERVAVASGKDYELWALPDGANVPKALGVLPPGGQTVTVPPTLRGPMQLMVSLEQKGGSPTGLPQGPVLWQGHLSNID